MIETVPAGTVLRGRYRIERVLGSGGFGHVYLAIDLMNNQQCAIKEYLVTGASGQEQLQHEARVLSQLHHANLPAFVDAFIERGRYYVALSYIEGSDLTDLIRMARQRNDVIPIPQMLNWLLAICDAVMFLHSQRPTVIHRDIKPDNIRITSNGTAVLVDLGNAKATADGARTLFFIRHQGTPGYAPPEQYPGGAGTDARSDIYALGGTLYFALTATEPPSVSTRNQSIQQGRPDLPSLQELVAANPPESTLEANDARQFRLGVTKPAKPAPRHSRHLAQLGHLPPEALNALNRIIQRAMAMRPRDRYQYVADFANDLKNVISTLPQPPVPDPTRPPDPNSTQPNLDEVFDAIQAQRDNAGYQGTNTSSPTQPMGSNNANNARSANPAADANNQKVTCPRCQAQLPLKSAFCPICGTQLQRGPSVHQTSRNAAQTDQAQQKAMAHAAQAAQTVAAPDPRVYASGPQQRQLQQQAQSFQQPNTDLNNNSAHSHSSGNNAPQQYSPQQYSNIQQQTGTSNSTNTITILGTEINLRKLLPIVIGALILLVLIIIFIAIR
jgi:serine/threonine protein kinase